VTGDGTGGAGYGKPPKHAQFKRGKSGNPSGRPKGSRNFRSDLRDELNAVIAVEDRGRAVEITKQRAIVKSFVAKAIDGDLRAIAALLGYFGPDNDDAGENSLSPEDQEIVDEFAGPRTPPRDAGGEDP
jgi:hypothetical protein